MKRNTRLLIRAGICAALAIAAGIFCPPSSQAQSGVAKYEIDLSWPKPLPDRWVLGGLGGVCVDAQDHVFILNRQDVLDAELNAGKMAPLVIELDPAGRVVNSWGDPNLLESRLHSCHVDSHDSSQKFMYVINQNSAQIEIIDRQTGKILSSFGGGAGHFPGQFDQPHGIAVDSKDNVYVAENRGKRIQKFKIVGP